MAHVAGHHAERIHSAVDSGAAARSPLVASWRRSAVLHGLDPAGRSTGHRLTEAELRRARQRIEDLIDAARPTLDRLFAAVGGSGCCVLLADADGVPVERRGAAGDDRTFAGWGLWTGTVWSEDAEGTNGIGTSLVERRAVTIDRDQHFLSRNTVLGCTSAPLHDADGRLAGALDVSSCRADLTASFLALAAMAVADAARQIEAECFRRAFAHGRVIVVAGGERVGPSLIAVDDDDLVIGATRAARQALGITPDLLRRPLPAGDLIGGRADGLDGSERAVLCRALARAHGNVSAAAAALGVSRATVHRKLKRLGLGRLH